MSAAASPSSGAPVKDEPAGKPKKKKKSLMPVYIGGGLLLIVGLVMFGLMPITGTIQFGICRTFVEKSAIYPIYLDIVSVLERPSDVRIEYTVVNEFGDTLFHTITCVFEPDPEQTVRIRGIILDRKKLDPAEFMAFNKTIPSIIANPPDLTIPMPTTGDLVELWKPPHYD